MCAVLHTHYSCREADNYYYWATVDIPVGAGHHGGDDSYLSIGSMQQNGPDAPPWAGRQFPGDSDTHSNSSGPHTGMQYVGMNRGSSEHFPLSAAVRIGLEAN